MKKKRGSILTRQAITAAVDLAGMTANLVTVHVHRIRKCLPPGERIITVNGVGYVWEAK